MPAITDSFMSCPCGNGDYDLCSSCPYSICSVHGEHSTGNVKQVIVIRRDLKMRRGKEIAQGAHASIAWLTNRLIHPEPAAEGFTGVWVDAKLTDAEWKWVQGNFRKICVVVSSERELLEVYSSARNAGLVAELIEDSGLTEFHGQATYTAAAIGPDYDERIDPITGHLNLY